MMQEKDKLPGSPAIRVARAAGELWRNMSEEEKFVRALLYIVGCYSSRYVAIRSCI